MFLLFNFYFLISLAEDTDHTIFVYWGYSAYKPGGALREDAAA